MSEAAIRSDGVDMRLIPPGVADERAKAFTAVLARALDALPLDRFDLTDMDGVDARLLPALVRGFSMHEFVSEDMPERIVRRLLKSAIPLHVGKGRDAAVRAAVEALEMDCTILQWWRQRPMGAPNTNVTTVRIFEGWRPDQPANDPPMLRAAERAIRATQRWSQETDIRFVVATQGRVFLGAHTRSGGIIRVRPLVTDRSLPDTRIGTLSVSRAGGTFRIRPIDPDKSLPSSSIGALSAARAGGTFRIQMRAE